MEAALDVVEEEEEVVLDIAVVDVELVPVVVAEVVVVAAKGWTLLLLDSLADTSEIIDG